MFIHTCNETGKKNKKEKVLINHIHAKAHPKLFATKR